MKTYIKPPLLLSVQTTRLARASAQVPSPHATELKTPYIIPSYPHSAMRLHQLKLDFIPEQDRLLLRVSTDNQLEVRLWLTRRALRLLWPLLVQLLRSSSEVALQINPDARDALVGMQHERALRQANFADAFDEAPRGMPLGAEPILVARIHTNKDEGGNQVLGLLPQQGQGIHLTLDDTLLHSLCKLLQDAVAKADWDIALELPTLLAQTLTDDAAAPKSVN